MDPTKPKRKRRKRDYIAPGFAIVAIAIAVWSRWPAPKLPPPVVETETERKADLLKVLKVGMPIAEANKVLTGRGYQCFRLPPAQFIPGLSPLACSKEEVVREDVPPVGWQVLMRNDNNDNTTDLKVTRHAVAAGVWASPFC